jgi:DNA-binding transcriptional LysR family regulator
MDRSVDLIEERIDLALRVRVALTSDAALTMRSLGHSSRILVGSPKMASRLGGDIAALGTLPALGTSDEIGEIEWLLEREDGGSQRLRHEPRMTCSDFAVVRAAAIADLGVALLPDHVCAAALDSGQLVHLLPEWRAVGGRPPRLHHPARTAAGRARADRSPRRAISEGTMTPTIRS